LSGFVVAGGVGGFVDAVLAFFVVMSSPHRFKAWAPLQQRRQVAAHFRPMQASAPMIAAASRPVVLAVGAVHSLILLAVAPRQPRGQCLGLRRSPAPTQQPGAALRVRSRFGVRAVRV